MAFGITINKDWAVDQYAVLSEGYRPFLRYRYLEEDRSLDVGTIRVTIPKGTGLLYSAGLNGLDDLAWTHVSERGRGDLVIWPPPRELVRETENH